MSVSWFWESENTTDFWIFPPTSQLKPSQTPRKFLIQWTGFLFLIPVAQPKVFEAQFIDWKPNINCGNFSFQKIRLLRLSNPELFHPKAKHPANWNHGVSSLTEDSNRSHYRLEKEAHVALHFSICNLCSSVETRAIKTWRMFLELKIFSSSWNTAIFSYRRLSLRLLLNQFITMKERLLAQDNVKQKLMIRGKFSW